MRLLFWTEAAAGPARLGRVATWQAGAAQTLRESESPSSPSPVGSAKWEEEHGRTPGEVHE
ncbi:hypothetical protein Dda_0934 [Drechslerella dactyloides]|uniref:Uncharacterized protein n=1 Tax=Drechslerella dactyloides TaxID=74499 RepID=A0AAD6J6H2_DREDA|nr:hypothetical protein Dda_0934 [Drechslerella dactyloides]